ncbi:MAG: hypothetical protein R2687_04310 [Candidatus Nanopelagicales bacterium]
MIAWVRFVDMQADEWPDLTDVELRATALDRLDLHYEHQDALNVTRGSWELSDYVRRFSDLQVVIGEHVARGEVLSVGADSVHLSTALVRLSACDEIQPLGRGGGVPASPVSFRQSIRQLAGRVPRELILTGGRKLMVRIDWVAADFLHARSSGRPSLVPLSHVAAVLGRIE